MARTTPAALLAKLGQLAQARFAAELLATERRAQLLGPALAALEELPIPEARPALRKLYDTVQDAAVREAALALIAVEADAKYQKKYASAWRAT